MAVVPLVVLSLGVGYIAGTSGRQTTTLTTTQFLSTTDLTFTATSTNTILGCDRPYSNSTVEGTKSNSSSVVFDTNSTSWVCVNIYNGYSDGIAAPDYPPTASILQGGSWVNTDNLNVTVQPTTIQVPANGVGWFVFEITPRNMSQGIYNVGLPNECWGEVVVAVGYSVVNLQGLQLSIPRSVTTCPAQDGYSSIVSTTDLVATYTK